MSSLFPIDRRAEHVPERTHPTVTRLRAAPLSQTAHVPSTPTIVFRNDGIEGVQYATASGAVRAYTWVSGVFADSDLVEVEIPVYGDRGKPRFVR